MKNAFKSFLILGLLLGFQSCKDNPAGPGGGLGGKIVFSMTTGATPYSTGESHIYVMNADGSGLRQLTFGSYEDMPRWSPDGSQIVFVSDSLWTSLGNPLWIMKADGSNWRPVKYYTTVAQPGENPSWSPDGKKIAFDWCTHCEYGVMIWDIYVVDLTTEGINKITFGEGDNGYPIGSNVTPVFSPDGRRIYFNSSRNDSINRTIAGIFSMNPDGSDVQGVIVTAPTVAYHVSPSLSPDGTKIAFAQGDSSGNSLFTANVDGSNAAKLTNPPNGTFLDLPRWSQHSGQIMFVSGGSIFVINDDGTNLRKLAVEDSVGYFDWTGK